MMNNFINYDYMKELFPDITDDQLQKFDRYAQLLCEWNERINLTAITDPDGIALKHFYDSVYPLTLRPPERGARLIDVGTGAGFPSIPFAIIHGDVKLTLLDSLNKRINFLKTVCCELGITAECVHARAEEAGRAVKGGNPYRESFDCATARAVARLSELCEYCLPFIKVGGCFYALKGKNGVEELSEAENAVKLLGGEVDLCHRYSLPNGDERTLIVIGKVKSTPDRFPRNSGRIKKEQLQCSTWNNCDLLQIKCSMWNNGDDDN